MRALIGLICGIIFSLGLGISGMVDPNVVLGFLDVFGKWNPSLMLVMVGAIGVNIWFYKLILKRNKTHSGEKLHLPTKTKLDVPLILGAVLFGLGWGLSGVCPGPALANFFLMDPPMLTFIASMIGGMLVYKVIFLRKS